MIKKQFFLLLSLPPSILKILANLIAVALSIYVSLQGLGFRGDMGYQTFLYPNEADIRRLMIFLVEKLPKDSATSTDEPQGMCFTKTKHILMPNVGL